MPSEHFSDVHRLRIAVSRRESGLLSIRVRQAREIAQKEQELQVIRAELEEALRAEGPGQPGTWVVA